MLIIFQERFWLFHRSKNTKPDYLHNQDGYISVLEYFYGQHLYWSILPLRKELGLFSLEKNDSRAYERIKYKSVYINTWREVVKKLESGSFQWCLVTKQKANGHKLLEHKMFHLNIKKHITFSMKVTELWPREFVESPS